MGFQAKGDLYGSDKCANYISKIVTQNAVFDYSAPMKSTALVGKFGGPTKICVSMNRWDVYNLQQLQVVMYTKGNRIVNAITWQPTLKTGKQAPAKETDIMVYSFTGAKCSRFDVTWGNWINFDSITGDPPKADNNPMLTIAKKMLVSWRTGKFHGSNCASYYGAHFTTGAVIDPRGPTGAASSIMAKSVGRSAGCAWFQKIEKFALANLNDIFYTKGTNQIVQAQTGKISYGGGPSKSFCQTAMISTSNQNMLTLYDIFWCKPKMLDSIVR
jgi:hypothetical protein